MSRKWKRLFGDLGAFAIESAVQAWHESTQRVAEQQEEDAEADEVEDDDAPPTPRASKSRQPPRWGGMHWHVPPSPPPNFDPSGGRRRGQRPASPGDGRGSPPPSPPPPPPVEFDPYKVLGMTRGLPLKAYKQVYKVLSEIAHPDKGSSGERQVELNRAIAEIRAELEGK